ncbi:DnaJ-class molecular chaperone [Bacillus pakistanensis]|uniref:DnaJ-class molecular chaperone n=1 Tax=Rossellomorea pakistanensis TaxID=992288 RepID=A0ABS2NCM1_9BACI|nr:methionine aminopeptidase [Bacillus pakistanensis]MBM7585591.1 DnaJ-class molecular chaperone [Bacillus pakistanensis]
MGLLNAINEWRTSRYENHVSKMKEANNCPECRGRGFLLYPANEYSYSADQFNCNGCNGSGLYSDWDNLR